MSGVKENNKFIQDAIDCHMQVCKEAGDSMPLLYLEKQGHRAMLPLDEMQQDFNLRSPMDLLKPIIEVASPDVYCFCGEAWMSKIKTKTKEGIERSKKFMSGELRPSEDPNKVEIFIVVAGTKDGKTRSIRQWDIIRDKNHKIIDFVKNPLKFDNFESEKVP